MHHDDIHVQTHGMWERILAAAGVDPEILDGNHHPCPVCGGTDRFRFDNKNGTGSWTCSGHGIRPGKTCGAGKGIDLLKDIMSMRAMDTKFASVVKYARELAGFGSGIKPNNVVPLPFAQSFEDKSKEWEQNRQTLAATWKEAGKDLGKFKSYLVSRGLEAILNDMPHLPLRLHAAHPYYVKVKGEKRSKKIGRFPTLMAWFQSPEGKVVCIHRTYLDKDGSGKAPVYLNTETKKIQVYAASQKAKCKPGILESKAKKMMSTCGDMHGGAIRLYDVAGSDVLCIAEGIETALAIRIMTGLPVWACYSAGMMANFDPPEGIREVMIFADHDQPDPRTGIRPGTKAANDLEKRLLAKEIQVRKYLPKQEGSDWLDEYLVRKVAKAKSNTA